MAIDIFSPRQISAALMLSGHCPNKLMPCRTCFIWANSWSTKVFNCASGNPGWAAASPVKSSAKIRSASLILGKASWPLMVFSIIATRWLVILAGAERTVATCPCLALLSRISAIRRKRSAFATDVPPNFNTRMVVTSLPLVEKKSPHCQVRAFFCVSCTRQPAPLPVVMVMVVVMVVLMRFMDVVYSVIFICLCAMPILVKVFSDLSQ